MSSPRHRCGCYTGLGRQLGQSGPGHPECCSPWVLWAASSPGVLGKSRRSRRHLAEGLQGLPSPEPEAGRRGGSGQACIALNVTRPPEGAQEEGAKGSSRATKKSPSSRRWDHHPYRDSGSAMELGRADSLEGGTDGLSGGHLPDGHSRECPRPQGHSRGHGGEEAWPCGGGSGISADKRTARKSRGPAPRGPGEGRAGLQVTQ